MLKKTLAAAAVLATLSTGALAADVELYGVVDMGFTYNHNIDLDTDNLQMNSGNYAGSRFGLRGTEDLGDNLKVGFILENGFAADSGALGYDGRLFGRESQLYLTGDWGQVGVGRFGPFTSGCSSTSWYWDFEPFETGYMDAGVQATQVNTWRLNDNAIYYVSPTFAGVKFGIQHSFTGTASSEQAKFGDDNSFTNIAVRWDGANAKAILGVEMDHYGRKDGVMQTKERDNAYAIKLAGAWTPAGGPATVFVGANYFKNYDTLSDATFGFNAYDTKDSAKGAFATDAEERLEAWSAFVGGRYTIGQADLLAMVQYMDGENKGEKAGATETDFSRLVFSLGTHYHFSKRTMLYAIASYGEGDGMLEEYANGESDRFMAHLGLTHFF